MWQRKSGGCVFDGSDHEGEVSGYLVPQNKWHALMVKPRRISDPPSGNDGETPTEPGGSPLCERHAKVMGVPQA
jgi:hypothetical protein